MKEIFKYNGNSEIQLNHWPALEGGPPLFLGTWGKNVKTAASKFDGWIASAHYRTSEEILEGLKQYRSENGKRAIVSTIQIGKDTDTGELKEKLRRFSEAGFDDHLRWRIGTSRWTEMEQKYLTEEPEFSLMPVMFRFRDMA